MSFFLQVAHAASTDSSTLLSKITDEILYPLISLTFGIALIYFLWGVFKFVKNADNPEEREKGGKHILWGIVGMAIMVCAYGLIGIIQATLNQFYQ